MWVSKCGGSWWWCGVVLCCVALCFIFHLSFRMYFDVSTHLHIRQCKTLLAAVVCFVVLGEPHSRFLPLSVPALAFGRGGGVPCIHQSCI